MITLNSNTVFVGDIPAYDKYISGDSIKPTDTRFRVDEDIILYFSGVPKNIEQYVEYSAYPIHIYVEDMNNIPKGLNKKFKIIDNSSKISIFGILNNIFYNPNRHQVYDILLHNAPPIPLLHSWLKQNIVRILGVIPGAILKCDERCINILPQTYYYSLVAYGITSTTNRRKLKWMKQKEQ